jgi:hypothetical protein
MRQLIFVLQSLFDFAKIASYGFQSETFFIDFSHRSDAKSAEDR